MARFDCRRLITVFGMLVLAGCGTTHGTGIGERSRIVSDKYNEKPQPYRTQGHLLAAIQGLAGDDLQDFQTDELVKINGSLDKELDVASQVYIKKVASITGLRIEVLDKLRPQVDAQTIPSEETVLFPFIEAKRQRKLSVQERDLLTRLDNQRRIDISHIHTRYAQQIAAVTGLPMPAIYGALITPYN